MHQTLTLTLNLNLTLKDRQQDASLVGNGAYADVLPFRIHILWASRVISDAVSSSKPLATFQKEQRVFADTSTCHPPSHTKDFPVFLKALAGTFPPCVHEPARVPVAGGTQGCVA